MTPPDSNSLDVLGEALDELRREGEELREELLRLQRTHARLTDLVLDHRAQLEDALRRCSPEEIHPEPEDRTEEEPRRLLSVPERRAA